MNKIYHHFTEGKEDILPLINKKTKTVLKKKYPQGAMLTSRTHLNVLEYSCKYGSIWISASPSWII